MSESRPPGTTRSIAACSAASVSRTSRAASSLGGSPTNTVTALSAWKPSQIAPKSSATTSPSASTRSSAGMPWTISSPIDTQIVAGNGIRPRPPP